VLQALGKAIDSGSELMLISVGLYLADGDYLLPSVADGNNVIPDT
jgi:hypothetical protein